MVGAGFGAYARLLHPLDDHPGPLTWATVARANSRILHPSAWWEKIKSSASSGRGRPGDPMRGDLNGWALKAALRHPRQAHHDSTGVLFRGLGRLGLAPRP